LAGNTEGKRTLGRLRVDGRIIRTMILKQYSERVLTGFSWIRKASGGWCELGNGGLASTKCGEFLDFLRKYLFMKRN
jgi:hypothetical protein